MFKTRSYRALKRGTSAELTASPMPWALQQCCYGMYVTAAHGNLCWFSFMPGCASFLQIKSFGIRVHTILTGRQVHHNLHCAHEGTVFPVSTNGQVLPCASGRCCDKVYSRRTQQKMCLEHPPCSEHWEPLGFALSLSLYAAIAFDTQAKLLKCLKQAAQMWLILWDCTMDIEVSVVPRTLMFLCLTGYNSSCYLRDPREHQVPTILELQRVLWENTVACRGGTKKWTALLDPQKGDVG